MTQILKPLRPSGLLSEEEALKDLESVPVINKAPQKERKAKAPGGLGTDYGLILTDDSGHLMASKDGKSRMILGVGFHSEILFHNDDLYFGHSSSLMHWPFKLADHYDGTITSIACHEDRIVVGVNHTGIFSRPGDCLHRSGGHFASVAAAGGQLFYSHSITDFSSYEVHQVGGERIGPMYCHGELTSLDDVLLIPGWSKIYQYDGREVKEFDKLRRTRGMAAVAEKEGTVIYAGRENGIFVIHPKKRRGILQKLVYKPKCITTAPLDFIDYLEKTKKI